MALSWNGRPVATKEVDPQVAFIELDVPSEHVLDGVNTLAIDIGTTVRPRDVAPAMTDPRPLGIGLVSLACAVESPGGTDGARGVP